MRVLLVLLIIIGVAGYFTRPSQGLHQGVATELIADGKVAIDPAVRATAFGDFFVVTKSETWSGDKRMLQCWGFLTRFLCFGPAEATAATTVQS